MKALQIKILSLALIVNATACTFASDEVSTNTNLQSHLNCTIFNADDEDLNGSKLPLRELTTFLNTPKGTPFSYADEKGAQAISCVTHDLLPNETDLKILLAGFPVFKRSSNSMPDDEDDLLAFEIVSGQLRVRTINGKLNDTEKLQDALNRLQLIIQDEHEN